ncbi:MAG: hypothetical protein RLZZ126_926 [Pseudomonadota bacterium]|jgi:phytanoyl-CoA hydroxylase
MSFLSSAQTAHWQQQGYLVLPKFKAAHEVQAATARARAIVDAFDIDQHRSVFSTQEQARRVDDAFLDSAEGIHCFLEEEALDPQGRLTRPKAECINKIGHALHDLDPVMDAFSHGAALAALAQDTGLVQPQVWQSMFIFKQPRIGGEVRWHQDATFFMTEPHSVTTFWFALEDATVDNGCLWVQPGGHRSPLRECFARPSAGSRQVGMQVLDRTPWPTQADALPLPAQAGDLVLLHGRLPHYSAANRSAHSRLAYTLHATCGTAAYSPLNWLQRSQLPVRGFDPS